MSTYVVVGGVAGGATAATRLRRRDEHADVILIERGKYVSFANCGLPYHIGGRIEEREKLLVSSPEELKSEFAIDVRTEHEVLSIDREAHIVKVRRLADGSEYDQPYDKLVLSPGATAFVPPVPGHDLPGVFSLRNIPDMDDIKAYIAAHGVKETVVIGGGFIGLEMAESLHERGLLVTVVEMLPQVMSLLDFELAALLHRELRQHDVGLHLSDGVKAIHKEDDRFSVELQSGARVPAGLVIMAVGVRPHSELAKDAGLTLGPRGHIDVNEYMQTSDPDIYAVGDAIQTVDLVTGLGTAVPLAGPANRQARVAASHITGLDLPYKGAIGTGIVKLFNLTAATTGANTRSLERAGIAYRTTTTHSQDHVGYYPGSTPQVIKLLWGAKDGKILGGQVVGYNAVDRTVDVLATAITAGMTVYDLEDLELAYAPPLAPPRTRSTSAALLLPTCCAAIRR